LSFKAKWLQSGWGGRSYALSIGKKIPKIRVFKVILLAKYAKNSVKSAPFLRKFLTN
jgi:hypothetical protein